MFIVVAVPDRGHRLVPLLRFTVHSGRLVN